MSGSHTVPLKAPASQHHNPGRSGRKGREKLHRRVVTERLAATGFPRLRCRPRCLYELASLWPLFSFQKQVWVSQWRLQAQQPPRTAPPRWSGPRTRPSAPPPPTDSSSRSCLPRTVRAPDWGTSRSRQPRSPWKRQPEAIHRLGLVLTEAPRPRSLGKAGKRGTEASSQQSALPAGSRRLQQPAASRLPLTFETPPKRWSSPSISLRLFPPRWRSGTRGRLKKHEAKPARKPSKTRPRWRSTLEA